uniref:Hexosyltransferase n=1 Tax=Ascaris lumbricoides TaxID=6252 RepID=A0A0M3HXP6_ASCLU
MIPMRVNNLHAVSLLLLVILFWIIVICGFFYQTSMTEKSDSRIVIAKKLIRRHPGLTIREHINNRSDKKEASDQLDFEKQFERNLAGLDLYRYRWTILERDFCSTRYRNLFLLIIVHTAVSHVKERQAIREMWGNIRLYDKYKSAVVFALGETTNETLRRIIKQESTRYRDIIQQNFLDAYKLLVLKGLMWIRFVAEYCPKVPFIMKLDDDVAVNYIAVLRFLTIRVRRKLLPNKRLIMCRLMDGSPAIRDKNNKWYISSAEYPNDVFSAYCSGLAFIITSDLIRPMMKEAQKSKLIWVDDFFLTGYLTANASVTFEDIGSLYEMNAAKVETSMSGGLKLFGVVRSVNQHKRVWKKMSSHYQ